MARPELHLSQNHDADELLSKDPLALLIGMVLDQQVPLEWAFAAPLELSTRLEHPLDANVLADMDPQVLGELFSRRPALHRYPGAMAGRVQEMCRLLVQDFEGRADKVWTSASSGEELLATVKALPGFGDQKAKIFVALLGKQLGVRPAGWENASNPYGTPGVFRSVADIIDDVTLAKVRAFKQEQKAKAGSKSTPGTSPRATKKPSPRATKKPSPRP
ncbi:MAG TPA: HhH-GPD-type base excision DNA repair protein [Acidimicrobiales bacterium]|nr:HhH-GPD-type base excision DNA repair protein [Acidimicrobiales bacterium]